MKIRLKKQIIIQPSSSNFEGYYYDGGYYYNEYNYCFREGIFCYGYILKKGLILNVEREESNGYLVKIYEVYYYISKDDAEVIDEKVDDNLNKPMNLKEKFVLAITPEPKKSFRKAGVTDGDDILTEEGTEIFLTWLLHHKFAEEFKKDVVDGILKEKLKEKE